jgi:fermentation-respiration switch protein FrsA (DUF1100 family)
VSATPRWSVRRLLLALVTLIVVGYGAAAVWLMSQETSLVFKAGRQLGPARPKSPFEQIDLPRSDGLKQFAWVMPNADDATDRPWVLYLHGNAATVSQRTNIYRYEQLRALGVNVFAPEYRGYGGLDGTPTERGLYADARVAYDYLRAARQIPADRIVVYGWSLGGAVAVHLASEVRQAGVILEGAPASLVGIGQAQYPLFPIRLLMRNPFDAVLRVGQITSPLLFLHSPEDTIVPFGQGRQLFDAARASKTFVEIRGGHVNSAELDGRVFFGAISKFLHATVLTLNQPAPVLH